MGGKLQFEHRDESVKKEQSVF